MLAPATFMQTNGRLIAIDACDVCVVTRLDDSTQITYIILDTTDFFTTYTSFQDVLTILSNAKAKAKRNNEDSWGLDYDEDCNT
jgi:hypothetical protein